MVTKRGTRLEVPLINLLARLSASRLVSHIAWPCEPPARDALNILLDRHIVLPLGVAWFD
jgi:hypothetical protein